MGNIIPNFQDQFGSFGNRAGTSNNANEERARAQFWINLGYVRQGKDEQGNDTQYFVALAGLGGKDGRSTLGGIALDSMADFPLTGSANMQSLRKQQNELRAMFLEAGEKLAPGESRIVSADPNTGLAIELRRVAEAVNAEDVETEACPVKLVI